MQGLYEEWAQYLRSMQSVRPVLETVPVDALVQGVVLEGRRRQPERADDALEERRLVPVPGGLAEEVPEQSDAEVGVADLGTSGRS